MNLVSLRDIIIPDNRQRREFDPEALAALQKSISTKGLIHPICLRARDNLTLVAGERRLRAITALAEFGLPFLHDGSAVEAGMIPVVFAESLDPIILEEIELEENVLRKDLTWQEHAAAVARLAELRKTQALAAGAPTPTMTDIASEVKGSRAVGDEVTKVRDDILLAKHLDDPEIAKAKTKSDATKILRKKLETADRAARADDFAKVRTPHTLLHGDSVKILTSLPDSHFDILLCDPPYGIGMDSMTSWDGSKHGYDDSFEGFNTLMQFILPQIERVLKPNCHGYMFCDIRNWKWLENLVRLHAPSLQIWPRPFIWYKGNIGAFPKPDLGPRYTYEAVLYFTRGEKKTTGLYQDVIPINQSTQQKHPAGKPAALIYDLLRRSAEPGDRVLDPFCGSGPIFPAATKANCIATGIELSDEYHLLALERLASTSIEE